MVEGAIAIQHLEETPMLPNAFARVAAVIASTLLGTMPALAATQSADAAGDR